MARRINQSLGGASTLSYIDMISGGFGSAFFLFLIFVSFPIETASTPSSGSRYLDVWIEWRDETASVYLAVKFTPERPAGLIPVTYEYSLNSQTLHRDNSSGFLSYSGTAPKFWVGIAEAGFTQTGRSGLTRRDEDGTLQGQWLRFADPCPGTFEISIGSLSPGNLSDLLASSEQSRTVNGFARVVVSDGQNVVFQPGSPPEMQAIAFNVGLGTKPISVVFDDPIVVTLPATFSKASLVHCEQFQ